MRWLEKFMCAPARTNAEDHRKIAADYRREAEGASTASAKRELLLMAQEHLLLAEPDPLVVPPRRS